LSDSIEAAVTDGLRQRLLDAEQKNPRAQTDAPHLNLSEPVMSQMQPHRGTMVLVLGILGIVLCQILGIVAWVMGKNDLKAMDAGQMDPEGRGMTQAGKILGLVSMILLAIGIVISIIWVIFAVVLVGAAAAGAAGSGGGR
jgi:hypothetical protein